MPKIAKKTKENKFKNEVIGISLILVAILISLALLNSSDSGFIGKFLYRFVANIFGANGAWFLVLMIVFMGISKIINDQLVLDTRLMLNLLFLLITVLSIIHIFSIPADKLDDALNLGLKSQGGGIIGGIFVILLIKALGYWGMVIALVAFSLLNILLITRLSFVDFFKRIFDFIAAKLNAKQAAASKKPKKTALKKDSIVIEQSSIRRVPKKTVEKSVVKVEKPKPATGPENSANVEATPKQDAPLAMQLTLPEINYSIPSLDLLEDIELVTNNNQQFIRDQAFKIEETLKNFRIESRVTRVAVGPTITRYELQIAAGIKVSKVSALEDDIALSLAVAHIRIEAPIPGKSAIGIEVPNESNSTVHLKQVLTSSEYKEKKGNLIVGMGLDISGKPVVADICSMPHMLIAGATGSGKSVCINVIINSILFRFSPASVKFVMIDPKRVELSCYNGLPHLLTPVVTDAKKASSALFWVVQEMDKRYEALAKRGARDINKYNEIVGSDNVENSGEKLPFIVVIIDELADLMMVASSDVEDAICRIAQMGRAAGIHLVVGTQRPSVDVITGLIKANIPARIAFAVSSAIDSRTILDMSGAEKLLGKGDMLYAEPGTSKPIRVQGAFISDSEVARVVDFISDQASVEYVKEDFQERESFNGAIANDRDQYFNDVVRLVVENNSASISMIQRRFRVGYARAARIIDQLEQAGIVGGYEGSKPRKVYADTEIVRKILNETEEA